MMPAIPRASALRSCCARLLYENQENFAVAIDLDAVYFAASRARRPESHADIALSKMRPPLWSFLLSRVGIISTNHSVLLDGEG
jgi:hypothetical protein